MFGVRLSAALEVAEQLDAIVVDMRFVKPLDEALVRRLAAEHSLFVTIEENALMGGAGSAVGEFLAAEKLSVPLLQLGLPDLYVEHAQPAQMLAECGLDAAGILQASATAFSLDARWLHSLYSRAAVRAKYCSRGGAMPAIALHCTHSPDHRFLHRTHPEPHPRAALLIAAPVRLRNTTRADPNKYF